MYVVHCMQEPRLKSERSDIEIWYIYVIPKSQTTSGNDSEVDLNVFRSKDRVHYSAAIADLGM